MRWFRLVSLTAASALAGCGGGLEEFPVSKVSGKVTCAGKPVPNVRIYFTPVAPGGKGEAGRQGMGNASEDGAFTVSTYGENDGAVVGKHLVMVATPHPEDFPKFRCDCETSGRDPLMEVEVKKGEDNNFVLEMRPKKNKNVPNIRPSDLQDIKVSSNAGM
jgi:hypothetical protein